MSKHWKQGCVRKAVNCVCQELPIRIRHEAAEILLKLLDITSKDKSVDIKQAANRLELSYVHLYTLLGKVAVYLNVEGAGPNPLTEQGESDAK